MSQPLTARSRTDISDEAIPSVQDACATDARLGGVVIERRQFLSISLSALAAMTTVNFWNRACARQSSEESRLSWEALVDRALPLAERFVESDSPDEETYLMSLSRLIGRRSTTPRASFDLTRPVAVRESLRRLPILVLQLRLAPGAGIPHHDHRDYIGVLTVTEGALRIRSFKILGSDPRPPPARTFQIRETGNSLLAKDAQSTLSRTRDNVHELRAGPEGARFIDFFTCFNPGAHSVYLNVAEQPRDPTRRVFDASWA